MSYADERPRDACGVVGVVTTGSPASELVRRGLIELQHRGEESAGIVTSDADMLLGPGLVVDALPIGEVRRMRGNMAIGHVRYSTAGAKSSIGAQPVVRRLPAMWFAVAHNGNLVNCPELAAAAGLVIDDDATDSELVADLIAQLAERLLADGASPDSAFDDALAAVLPRLVGSFSLVFYQGARVIGVRDRNGIRPLTLGRLADGWVIASETPAIDAMRARVVRDVQPGEIVVIEAGNVRSFRAFPRGETASRLCMFEFVYFARPDGRLEGRSVERARHRAGAALADHAPLPPGLAAPAVVIPVPSSAVAAARGYAERSGLPYAEGLRRNADIGRSFLAPAQAQREAKVSDKLVAVPELVAGRRVVVVDDSLVRGTTTRTVVKMLRAAGAVEVHLRIASPPWRWPCHLGIDVARRDDLAAAMSTLSEMSVRLGCDSLAYLPVEDVLAATGRRPDEFCTGCITGRYPVRVPTPVLIPLDDLFTDARTLRPAARGAVA